MMKRWLILVLAILFLLFLTACGNDSSEPPTSSDGIAEEDTEKIEGEGDEIPPPGTEAEDNSGEGTSEEVVALTIEMLDSDGNANGTAELTEKDNAISIVLDMENLETGMHGVQFHENGQCEVPDFESAGEPLTEELPAVEAADDGTVSETLAAEGVTLKIGEENSLLQEGGTSLVVYAQEEDGERVACGVVTTE